MAEMVMGGAEWAGTRWRASNERCQSGRFARSAQRSKRRFWLPLHRRAAGARPTVGAWPFWAPDTTSPRWPRRRRARRWHMRFRCSGNGCPIRGPLCICCSARLWGLPADCRVDPNKTHPWPCSLGWLQPRGSPCTCPHRRVPGLHGACARGTSPHHITSTGEAQRHPTAAPACQDRPSRAGPHIVLSVCGRVAFAIFTIFEQKGHGHAADNS